MRRRVDIQSFAEQTFDLIIIGGGITGAGILHEAARRGYKCLLLEKGDFASGTSSKSGKQIHGGIRYLKQGQFKLVKESLRERNYLLEKYPQLVKPLQFLFPFTKSKLIFSAYMAVYQFLSRDNRLPKYRFIGSEETCKIFPYLNSEKLKGSFIYYDAVTDDARLCNEVIDDAQKLGKAFAVNYCEVVSLKDEEGGISRLTAHDNLENCQRQFRAKYVINAAGIWTNEVLNRLTSKQTNFTAPSKGVHIVVAKKRFPTETAIIVSSGAGEGRMLYVFPWEYESVIVGTTDTEYFNSIDKVKFEDADVEYLIQALQSFAPSLNLSRSDVLFTYSGLRPLMKSNRSSTVRSREYSIWWEGESVLNIAGGKLTSFHSMANASIDELAKKIKPLESHNNSNSFLPSPLEAKQFPVKFSETILEKFPAKAREVFAIAEENTANITLLHPDFEVTLAELIYYIRNTQCYHLDDLLTRRLSLTYVLNGAADKNQIIQKVAEIMKEECGWSDQEFKNEIASYNKVLAEGLG
ncbi:MAG: glycerol-3-phosphate dehydrogenase/oxidase [Pyrinomonadaceae bacterium]